jgi:hypothetical protein
MLGLPGGAAQLGGCAGEAHSSIQALGDGERARTGTGLRVLVAVELFPAGIPGPQERVGGRAVHGLMLLAAFARVAGSAGWACGGVSEYANIMVCRAPAQPKS